jgi:hypothetical protein
MEEGKRFSQVYLERLAPLRDSVRFRNRLVAYYWEHLHDVHEERIRRLIQRETGAEIPFVSTSYSLAHFFKSNEIRDILDSITLIYQVLVEVGWKNWAENWKEFVARILKEENLGYQLDSRCGVHYFVDEEFEQNRFSALAALEDPKYNGVRAAYEDAYRYLDAQPMDTKAAVRSMFEALEILVKQMVQTQNLSKWIVENTLKQKCLPLYQNEPTAAKVVAGLFDGFALWVDSLHNYRHGQSSEQPVAPKEEVAVYILSSGSAFLRWLVGINNDLGKQP